GRGERWPPLRRVRIDEGEGAVAPLESEEQGFVFGFSVQTEQLSERLRGRNRRLRGLDRGRRCLQSGGPEGHRQLVRVRDAVQEGDRADGIVSAMEAHVRDEPRKAARVLYPDHVVLPLGVPRDAPGLRPRLVAQVARTMHLVEARPREDLLAAALAPVLEELRPDPASQVFDRGPETALSEDVLSPWVRPSELVGHPPAL